jgi:hypothetical protein
LSLTLATPINFPGGRATLNTGVSNSETSFILDTGGGAALALGGATFRVLRIYETPISGLPEDVTAVEYLRCSAISTDTLTVARAQQGSTAQAWSAGAIIESVFTAADIDDLKTEINLKTQGPGSATDNAIARFDATTGKLLQNGLLEVDDSGNLVFRVAAAWEMRANAGVIQHIDYDNSSTGATWKIRADNTTDVFTVTEAGNTTIAGTLTQTGVATFNALVSIANRLATIPTATATITSGEATITGCYVVLDTEGAAASDDLVTVVLSGAVGGEIIFLRTTNSSRDVVCKHGTSSNNLRLVGAADFTLISVNSVLCLQRVSGIWNELFRVSI